MPATLNQKLRRVLLFCAAEAAFIVAVVAVFA